MNKQEIELLRGEIELLMKERTAMLKVVGAAAIWVSKTNVKSLPEETIEAAEQLSERLNALPEETLKDALDAQQG